MALVVNLSKEYGAGITCHSFNADGSRQYFRQHDHVASFPPQGHIMCLMCATGSLILEGMRIEAHP
jgi:hypothetical protein